MGFSTGHSYNDGKMLVNKKLLAEYKNPIKFIKSDDYRLRRSQLIKRSIRSILLGIVLLAFSARPVHDSHSYQTKSGGMFMLILGLWFVGLGMMNLLRPANRIIKNRRIELRWLHPELRSYYPDKDPVISSRHAQWITIMLVLFLILSIIIFGLYVIKSSGS